MYLENTPSVLCLLIIIAYISVEYNIVLSEERAVLAHFFFYFLLREFSDRHYAPIISWTGLVGWSPSVLTLVIFLILQLSESNCEARHQLGLFIKECTLAANNCMCGKYDKCVVLIYTHHVASDVIIYSKF